MSGRVSGPTGSRHGLAGAGAGGLLGCGRRRDGNGVWCGGLGAVCGGGCSGGFGVLLLEEGFELVHCCGWGEVLLDEGAGQREAERQRCGVARIWDVWLRLTGCFG